MEREPGHDHHETFLSLGELIKALESSVGKDREKILDTLEGHLIEKGTELDPTIKEQVEEALRQNGR